MDRVAEDGVPGDGAPEDRVIVCRTCAGGADLAALLRGRVGVAVEEADCLNVCERPASLALRGPGRDVYLFAGVRPADAADAAALVRLWQDAEGGRIEDARPAGRLRYCLLGRVPG